MAKLILLQEGEATTFELTAGETLIGRHPECAVQINSNMVSRRHARVVRTADEFLIEDMGSGNKTFVNGKVVEGPTPLDHDDRIKLGPILLRFECDVRAGQQLVPLRPSQPSRPAAVTNKSAAAFNL